MYIFLIHILFWFVLLITTSQSAGVLHVPACNHDRLPKAGIYFLCTCAVYHKIILTCCAYRHTRSRPVVGADVYCAGRIEDIKNNLVHYAYSEVSSLAKPFFTSVS